MKRPPNRNTPSKAFSVPRATPGQIAAALLLFFCYVYWRIEPALQYQHDGPVFRLTRSFLAPFLAYPGGPVDYAAAFLSQLSSHNASGALVYTSIAALILLAGLRVVGSLSGVGSPWSPFGVVFLLLIAAERYDYPSLSMSLGLLAALLSSVAYLELRSIQSTSLRLGLSWLLSTGLFYFAGLWPCLLLLLLVSLSEAIHRRPAARALGFAVPAAPAVLWLLCFRGAGVSVLLNPWCKGLLHWVVATGMFLLQPLECTIRCGLRPRSTQSPDNAPAPARSKRPAPAPVTHRARPAILAILFVVGWTVVWFGLADTRKRIAAIDYHSNRKEYAKVLVLAAPLTREQMDSASEARLHLALYHTGRLGEDLFSFRNQSGWDLFPGLGGGLGSCRAQSRSLFELGLVSEAEHMAHEALESEGERPELLRLLAEVNVLKERPRAARVFLNVLSQIPFQDGWAESCLEELQRDPQLTNDADVCAVRALMLTNDVAHQTFPPEGMLVQLLHRNPTNQMAFEYLMAEYLVTLQVNKLVDRLWQLDNFRYTGIPRHYEEALLLYQQVKGTTVELRGRKARAETVERFRRFNAAMEQRLFSTEEGRRVLARDFGDTYWYYYVARQGQTNPS